MPFRTIVLSLALASAVMAIPADAHAGGRVQVVSTPIVGDSRNAAADGIVATGGDSGRWGGLDLVDEDTKRHQEWHFVPLTGVIDKDPPLASDTPGQADDPATKPGVFTQTFSPDGKNFVEIRLACLTAAPLGIKVINVGDTPVPAGTMLKWSVKASKTGGAFELPSGLGEGQAVLVAGYKGDAAGSPCTIKLLG